MVSTRDLFFIDTGGSVELNIKRKRNALSEDAKKEKRETEQTGANLGQTLTRW